MNQQGGLFTPTGILAAAGVTAIVAAATVYDMGALRVSIREKQAGGHSIRLLVPAAVIPVAMRLVPDKALEAMPAEIRPYVSAIETAAEALERCPDGLLVQVDGPGQKVNIALRDGSLVIDVDSESEIVHAKVPLKAFESAVKRFERANVVRAGGEEVSLSPLTFSAAPGGPSGRPPS